MIFSSLLSELRKKVPVVIKFLQSFFILSVTKRNRGGDVVAAAAREVL